MQAVELLIKIWNKICTCFSCDITFFLYIVLICFYLNLLIFELAHSHMSFQCWNLALPLMTYNDILVYGQNKYLLSVYQYLREL